MMKKIQQNIFDKFAVIYHHNLPSYRYERKAEDGGTQFLPLRNPRFNECSDACRTQRRTGRVYRMVHRGHGGCLQSYRWDRSYKQAFWALLVWKSDCEPSRKLSITWSKGNQLSRPLNPSRRRHRRAFAEMEGRSRRQRFRSFSNRREQRSVSITFGSNQCHSVAWRQNGEPCISRSAKKNFQQQKKSLESSSKIFLTGQIILKKYSVTFH